MREPRKRAKVTCARSGGAVRMSGHVLALALFLCPLAASVPARAEEPSIDVLVDRVRNGAPEAFEQALAVLSEMGAEAAEAMPVLYGGSVTSASFGEFIDEPAIDGALIGGASLKPDEMAGIAARPGITAAARSQAA